MKKNIILAFSFALSLFVIDSVDAQYVIKLQEKIANTSTLSGGNGFQLITQYISAIYTYLASLVGVVAVLYIVVSGVQITLGGMKEDLVSTAKARILQSILSLVLLFGSALLLKYTNAQFFGNGGGGGGGGGFGNLLSGIFG